MKIKGICCTVLSALLFGVTPMLVRLTYEMGSTPATMVFYRNLSVVPMLAAVLLVQRVDFRIEREMVVPVIWVGASMGVTTLLLCSAYNYIGTGMATTLHFLYPVFVALLCRFCFHERLNAAKLCALALACVGIAFFLEKGSGGGSLIGVMLAAVSGLTYAVYMVGVDKKGLKHVQYFKLTMYLAMVVVVTILGYDLFAHQIHFVLPARALGLTVCIGMMSSFGAVLLLQIGIKYLSSSTAAIFCLFEPIMSNLCGVLFLHERLSVMKLVGSGVILAAAAILAVAESKNEQETDELKRRGRKRSREEYQPAPVEADLSYLREPEAVTIREPVVEILSPEGEVEAVIDPEQEAGGVEDAVAEALRTIADEKRQGR